MRTAFPPEGLELMRFWVIMGSWAFACALALWWVLPRVDSYDEELEREAPDREVESLDYEDQDDARPAA